jgi:hypothetical protein
MMTANHIRNSRRFRRIGFIHAGAISFAFVSGTFALTALLLGSPLQFGSALAMCGTGWIVAHIAERFAEQERVGRRRALEIERTYPTHFAPGYLRLDAPIRIDRHSPTGERVLSTV